MIIELEFLVFWLSPLCSLLLANMQGRILKSKFEWAIMIHLNPFKCFVWLQDSGVGTVLKVGALTKARA